MNIDGKEISAPKKVTDGTVLELIKDFIYETDLNTLAELASRYIYDEPVTITSEHRQGDSDTFQNGERVREFVSPNIPASAWTDSHVIEVDFDASYWFAQAAEGEIRNLATCGWRGDYPADNVAHYESEHNLQVSKIFDYIELVSTSYKSMGFECSVDTEAAMAWLKIHKPELYEEFLADEDIET